MAVKSPQQGGGRGRVVIDYVLRVQSIDPLKICGEGTRNVGETLEPAADWDRPTFARRVLREKNPIADVAWAAVESIALFARVVVSSPNARNARTSTWQIVPLCPCDVVKPGSQYSNRMKLMVDDEELSAVFSLPPRSRDSCESMWRAGVFASVH